MRAVHEVLRLAVATMPPASLAHLQEPDITGLLVKQMNLVVESDACPRNARYFVAQDDPPLNDAEHLGKRRPRVDIAILRVRPGPRPRFEFEAKRLQRRTHVSAYLGKDGLGCFLSARYGAALPDVGMLGYVQADTVDDWAERIAQELAARPHLTAWQSRPLGPAMPHTYRSVHDRGRHGPVDVFHTLIMCH